jgi:hypothetical protein
MRSPLLEILKFSGGLPFLFFKISKSSGGGVAQETQGRWSETWGLQF